MPNRVETPYVDVVDEDHIPLKCFSVVAGRAQGHSRNGDEGIGRSRTFMCRGF